MIEGDEALISGGQSLSRPPQSKLRETCSHGPQALRPWSGAHLCTKPEPADGMQSANRQLGGRSIRQYRDLPSQLLNTATHSRLSELYPLSVSGLLKAVTYSRHSLDSFSLPSSCETVSLPLRHHVIIQMD